MNNPLAEYFNSNQKRRAISKWPHYFDIYHRHFQQYRNKKIVVVELGLMHGGSIQMWKSYFGNNMVYYGVDIDERCKQYEERNVNILIGDQEDRKFLKYVAEQIGSADIIIDDGGHGMAQQINSFEVLYPIVKDGGVYLVEDVHTSYWKEFGGGYKKKSSFIEYTKKLIDQVNAWHSKSLRLKVNNFTKTIGGIHVYDSIVVFDKTNVKKPYSKQIGKVVLK